MQHLHQQPGSDKIMQPCWKNIAVTAFMLCTLAFSGSASAQESPDVLVKRISQEVITTAKTDKEIQGGDRQRIMQLVESKILPHTDFQRATKLVTGRYWRDATPLQQERLTEEFRKLLIFTYAGAMSQVRDQQIDVKPLRADPADTEVVVRSEFRQSRGAQPIQVNYRFAKSDDGWKIFDVNVMGVWLGETYKSSFSSEIGKVGIDGLIQMLSEKNMQLAKRHGG
jgi:phospholipid transport system substrate-binding protein